jgi:hypothetical protein
MIEDLTYGTDKRGDYAYFIEDKHILPDGWRVDDEARTGKSEAIFFRIICEGNHTKSHGWIEDNIIVQWG